jgi:hypothetical protein
MIERLLAPDDVAAILQVSRRTAYTIMHQMPHLERPFRVSESGLRAWLYERTRQPEDKGKGKGKARQRAVKMPLVSDYHIPRRKEGAG